MEKKNLNNLLLSDWKKIAVPGGEFKRISSPSVYMLSSLSLYINSNWIEISAEEINEAGRENEFYLEINILDIPPIPEPSKMNRPPRELVTVFPEDCRLDKLMQFGVANVDFTLLKSNADIWECDPPIIIESKDKDRFEINVSDKLLGDIEIRML